MTTNFDIYRLCRNLQRVEKLKEEEIRYSLPKNHYEVNKDLYTFLNEIIKNCPKDYALVCHDDVILPEIIYENANRGIKSANELFGDTNWGVLGNAGIDAASKETCTFIADPHTSFLPYNTKYPIIAESLDGNTLLLNIKSLRKENVSLPKSLKGFHLYDLILCMECYKKGLICGISSWLYTKHNSGGDYESFTKAWQLKEFQDYFRESFSNHQITSINGLIYIKRDYKHLHKDAPRLLSFEETIQKTIHNLYKNISLELNILIRVHTNSNKIYRLFDYLEMFQKNLSSKIKLNILLGVNNVSKMEISPLIEDLKKQHPFLNIKDIYTNKSKKRYPRVNTISEVLKEIETENSYTWIIDYDDFPMPKIAKHMQWILSGNDIVIGDSYTFEEKWGKTKTPLTSELSSVLKSDTVSQIITGTNYIPICSVIYKTSILKKIFINSLLSGDYYEDYAILLLAIKDYDYMCFPFPFAGISYHGQNTVLEKDRTHWNYSYATFLSEVVNKGVVDKSVYSFCNNLLSSSSAEFESFKKGLIWKYLQKYRKFRYFIKRTFSQIRGSKSPN